MDALKRKSKGESIKLVNVKEARCWTCDGVGHLKQNCSYQVEKVVCKVCLPAHCKQRPHNESQFCRDRAASRSLGRNSSRSRLRSQPRARGAVRGKFKKKKKERVRAVLSECESGGEVEERN